MVIAASSARVAEARAQVVQRAQERATWLRRLGVLLVAFVILTTSVSEPPPGTHGRGLAILVSLVTYLVALLAILAEEVPLAVLVVLAASGVVLSGLVQGGGDAVAPSAAGFICVVRRPDRTGIGLAAAVAAGLAVLTATAGHGGAGDVVSDLLLCAVLAIVGLLLQRARDSADRVQVLLAELEDAREAERVAAAAAERNRIAGDLHDVLAHALSGAAIQLEVARRLAGREPPAPPLADAVERASRLVRDGLADARDAVGALRGTAPGVADLPALADRVRADLGLDVTVRGTADGPVDPEAGLALYRGVQEALTNAARHAPGATVTVTITGRRVEVFNGPPAAAPPGPSPGGGHGLSGMEERFARLGGTATAGPYADGWRVVLELGA